ncbi:hypothetical protein MMC07_005926 [Pseudocyphellaria aurata]|nr:hypothetical protein [Pseudocyphellaria aurata]
MSNSRQETNVLFLEHFEERKALSSFFNLVTSPFSRISSPIRDVSSPIVQRSSQSIQTVLSKRKTPASKVDIRSMICEVDFEDPDSVIGLASKLTSKDRKDPIHIGKHVSEKVYFYSIQFGGRFFPMDFLPDETRRPTGLTYIRCDSPLLPKIFLQLGQLRYTHISNTDAHDRYEPELNLIKSTDTYFVLGIDIVDRMAWALWNPDQFDAIDGVFPGFQTACTAIPLNQTIDELLVDSSTRVLDINAENILTLSDGSSVTYGGVDEEGWSVLSKISSKYKAAFNARTSNRTV